MIFGEINFWLAAIAAGSFTVAGLSLLALHRQRGRPVPSPATVHTSSSNSPWHVLLDQIPDPIVLVDQRARVLEANKAAQVLLPAIRPDQPLSLALRSPTVLEALDRVMQTGGTLKTHFSERLPIERRFEVQIAAFDTGERNPTARSSTLLFFRDLTPAWRIERMRTDFVASASHELRTPLASILGFIETLQGPARNDPDARERFLEIMRDQAKRMTRLVDDLLSLARVEMRAHVPLTTIVDLNAVVAQVCQALEPLAQERSVTIALTAAERPARVVGDQDELVRVAENVVENAIKYGESGRKVEVQLRHHDGTGGQKGTIEFSVRDHGSGIAAEHLPRLTERFYRVDPTSSRQQGGTGLGLAIVKHIVNRHRGRLRIESELGQGTTVRITLPALAGDDGASACPRDIGRR